MEENSDSNEEYGLEYANENCCSEDFNSQEFRDLAPVHFGEDDSSESEIVVSPKEDFDSLEVSSTPDSKSDRLSYKSDENVTSCNQKHDLSSSGGLSTSSCEKPEDSLVSSGSSSKTCVTIDHQYKENLSHDVFVVIANAEYECNGNISSCALDNDVEPSCKTGETGRFDSEKSEENLSISISCSKTSSTKELYNENDHKVSNDVLIAVKESASIQEVGPFCKTGESGGLDSENSEENLAISINCSKTSSTKELYNDNDHNNVPIVVKGSASIQEVYQDRPLGNINVYVSQETQCNFFKKNSCDQSTQCDILLLKQCEKCKTIQCSASDVPQTVKCNVSTQYENPVTVSFPNLQQGLQIFISDEAQCNNPLYRSTSMLCDSFLISQETQCNFNGLQKEFLSLLPPLPDALDSNNVVSSSQQSLYVCESLTNSENPDNYMRCNKEVKPQNGDNPVDNTLDSGLNHSMVASERTESANLPEVTASCQNQIITSCQEPSAEDLLLEMNCNVPFDKKEENGNVTHERMEDSDSTMSPLCVLSSQEDAMKEVSCDKNGLPMTKKDSIVLNVNELDKNVQEDNGDTIIEGSSADSEQLDPRQGNCISWFNSLACERTSSPESLNEEVCKVPPKTPSPLRMPSVSSQETLLISSPLKKKLFNSRKWEADFASKSNESVPPLKDKQRDKDVISKENRDSRTPGTKSTLQKSLYFNSLACERASSPESLDEDTCTELSKSVEFKHAEKKMESSLTSLRVNRIQKAKSEYSKSFPKSNSEKQSENQIVGRAKSNENFSNTGSSSGLRRKRNVRRTVDGENEEVGKHCQSYCKANKKSTNINSDKQSENLSSGRTKVDNDDLSYPGSSLRYRKRKHVNPIIVSDSENDEVVVDQQCHYRVNRKNTSIGSRKQTEKQSSGSAKGDKELSYSGSSLRTSRYTKKKCVNPFDSKNEEVAVHQQTRSKRSKEKNQEGNWYATLRKKWARLMSEESSMSSDSEGNAEKERQSKGRTVIPTTKRPAKERDCGTSILNTSKSIVPYDDSRSVSSEELIESSNTDEENRKSTKSNSLGASVKSPKQGGRPSVGKSEHSVSKRMGDEDKSSCSSISDSDNSGFESWQPMVSYRKKSRQPYTHSERVEILKYIIKYKKYHYVSGVALWKDMEACHVCRGRTWQSLKEHFRKQILPRIKTFNLGPDIEKKFL